ncbi:hypothetical protein MMC25_005785 [Agyrium rufum]|nr:hypothetical protein [Agyrium rufum]
MDAPATMQNEVVPEFKPARFLPGDSEANYAILILNTPIDNIPLFKHLCANARIVICADGGANRVFDSRLTDVEETHFVRQILASSQPELVLHIDAICGDLDSVRPDVTDWYSRTMGTQIIRDPDQATTTDFAKCLKVLASEVGKPSFTGIHSTERSGDRSPVEKPLDVVVVGGLGGRADQAMSSLHHLYLAPRYYTYGMVYLFTAESVIFLLEKGLSRVHTPVSAQAFTENAGIVPLGRPSVITIRGFKWDVEDWETEFGGQISTSNHIRAEVVEVQTLERVIFTLELDAEVSRRLEVEQEK